MAIFQTSEDLFPKATFTDTSSVFKHKQNIFHSCNLKPTDKHRLHAEERKYSKPNKLIKLLWLIHWWAKLLEQLKQFFVSSRKKAQLHILHSCCCFGFSDVFASSFY